MKYFKMFLMVTILGVVNPAFSQDVKKNRDQICSYVSSIGNWVQGVINTFEGIVRFESGKGFSKAEMLAMKDQWIKTYKQRDAIAKENIETCNIRGNPFEKWERSHLNTINKNVGKANKMAGQLESFLNNYPDLKKLPACRDFLRAWNRMKKPDNYFR
jgi:hypothetical protein